MQKRAAALRVVQISHIWYIQKIYGWLANDCTNSLQQRLYRSSVYAYVSIKTHPGTDTLDVPRIGPEKFRNKRTQHCPKRWWY